MASLTRVIVVVSVSAAVLVACVDPAGSGRGTPGLSIVSGDGQTGTAGRPLGAPLVVRVRDAFGRVVAAAPVSWTVTTGYGSVPFASETDANGRSSVNWILGVEGVH